MIAYIYPAFWIFSHRHNNINHANTISVLDFRTAHSAVHDLAATYLYTAHSAHAFRIRINIRIGYTLSAWKQESEPGILGRTTGYTGPFGTQEEWIGVNWK